METAYSAKTLTQKIIDRQAQYETLRQPYDDRFSDIVDLVDPGLTAWSTNADTEGRFRGQKIYEGTPAWALRTMADGWLGSLVSETLRWLKYLFADKLMRDNDEVNKWLQDLEDQIYYVYRQSELYSGLAPYTRAALSVGSPVILPWEDLDSGKIKCEVPHPKENYHGPRDGYHRKYDITVMEAVRQFLKGKVPESPSGSSKLSAALINDYRNGHHASRYTFIRSIYRNDDPILEGRPQQYRQKPWMEFYVQKETTDLEQRKEPILIQGYWTKPHIRWDYEKNPEEFYARTPSWNAIQDIRSLQELAKQRIEVGQRSLNPPMWAMRKYRPVKMQPRAWNYYTSADERENYPRPIQEKIDYPIGVDVHDSIKNSVERWFHVPLFMQLSKIASEKTGSWPTATQIIYMNAEKAIVLAPQIGRFTNVLREIDTRFFDIERRAGRLPEPPDVVLEYMAYKRLMGDKKLRLDVEFLGPLAQMQQRGLTLGRTEAGLAIIAKYMALDGLLRHKVKLSVAMEKDLEGVGWPQDALTSEPEYQETLAAIAEKEAAGEMAEQLAAGTKMIPQLSKTVEPNSPLGVMTETA